MSENQIISFLEFVNQDDEDKYNMLVESAAIIRQKENIIKEIKELANKPEFTMQQKYEMREELLEILDKEKQNEENYK